MNVTYPTPHRFTVDEYHRMGQIGVLQPDARLELIQGEILDMTPIGSRHAACVAALDELFAECRQHALVWVQNPLKLSVYTEVQPDIVLLKRRTDRYAYKIPDAADALLVIEVCETTLSYDRDVKVPLYAAAGVPEVWLISLKDQTLSRYSRPRSTDYEIINNHHKGDNLAPAYLPTCAIPLAEILPEP
jgi:Uma2 family endonuclease